MLDPVLGQDIEDLEDKTWLKVVQGDFLEDLSNASDQHELECQRSARPVSVLDAAPRGRAPA